jgi:putative addiction module component (TIGR02574 family)
MALPAADRIELFERIRESLQNEPEAFPLSPAQEEELRRRYEEFLNDPEEGYSLEEVEAMLRREP